MKSSVRNRLAELLLSAFDDFSKRGAIEWLSVFCEMEVRWDRHVVPFGAFLQARRAVVSHIDNNTDRMLAHLIGPEKLLRLCRADTDEAIEGSLPGYVEGNPWLIAPQRDVGAAFPAVCERVRIYADLVARMGKVDVTSSPQEPLRKAVAEAGLCFNAGLFFEAHEHLEHHWAAMPTGPARRFLQGIIQISVGFHHARAGNYHGTVNQLSKGLEKTLGSTGTPWGLDCDAFLPRVATVRTAIVKRGRANMRPLPLSKIPRMRIRD